MSQAPDAAGRPGLPVSCTLGPVDGPDRLRRWQRLHERAAPEVQLRPGTLEVRYADGPGIAEELAELVAAERDCCAFVTWSTTRVDGRPTLRVTAPDGRPEAVDPVAAVFTRPRSVNG